ncbi:MAG: BMP family ABC transporter substrate-binding protein [Clostridia bacterium]|nr:BMP family ABC transporter substrate-binding protein [Clostridia bacterium]
MKKLLSLLLALAMLVCCFAFAACGDTADDGKDTDTQTGEVNGDDTGDTAANADFKLGVILLHDEFSTYDLNFMNGVEEAKAALGLSDDQIIMKKNIPESDACYEAACDLVDEGCDVIFADSFGHETYMLKAAKEFPDVEFCHATGTMAHTEGLANFHNAFASIYEGRYLAGVAAGLKLNAMIEDGTITAEQAKIGYVGAFTYAEVISGYTSFYLGAKSVCPSATMDVQFTGSWYDETAEKNAAQALIANNCVLISQHADSMGAPTACEEAGVPNVSYNGSTVEDCPNTFIVASRINWAPYFKLICENAMKGEAIPTDWTGTIATGSVVLTDVNTQAAAAGTVEKLEEVKAGLLDGTVKVFDTAADNFITVGGAKLETYLADVDTDDAFTPDTEAVADGYFHESEYRSAPYFDVRIDGITLLNDAY